MVYLDTQNHIRPIKSYEYLYSWMVFICILTDSLSYCMFRTHPIDSVVHRVCLVADGLWLIIYCTKPNMKKAFHIIANRFPAAGCITSVSATIVTLARFLK